MLQSWEDGKQSGVWVSVDIVVARCPGVTAKDFDRYLKDHYGKDPILRGFYLYECQRKAQSVYIFNRQKAQNDVAKCKENKVPEFPDVRMWNSFLECFVQNFNADREFFHAEVFQDRLSRLKVGYTWAGALFGIRDSRLALKGVLDDLLKKGLLPRPMAKVAASSSSSVQPLPPTPDRRQRRSIGGAENTGLEDESASNDLSREAIGVIECASELWQLTEAEAKKNNFALIAFEEWILEDAIEDKSILEMCCNPDIGPKAFCTELLRRWRNLTADCGDDMPLVFKADGERGLLKIEDARVLYRRLLPSVVGSRAHVHRMRRKTDLSIIRGEWASRLLFKPALSISLVEYVLEAKKYNSGYVLTHPRSLLARKPKPPKPVAEVKPSLPPQNPGDVEQAKQRRRSDMLKSHKEALTSTNEFQQTILSNRTIFLFHLAKEVGEISDTKWLLVLNLFLSAIIGEVLDISFLKQICINGHSLVTRARQLTWRIQQNIAEKINSSPGISTVATDDTEIHNVNAGARADSYFDVALDRPVYEIIDGSPTGRKTSDAGAAALVQSLKVRSITSFTKQRGGSSDNAPNASNTIFEFFDLSQTEAHGIALGPDGGAVVTMFNGIPVKCVWIGSGVHILHLLNGHFRKQSFGVKSGMDDPSGGQLPFKWDRVMRSDQRVSGRGTSIYQVLRNKFFGGKGRFWSSLMTEDHEGRWGQSLRARVEILRYLDYPMHLIDPQYAALGPNALAALAMFIRARLKPGSWQIPALLLVAIWSCSPSIVWSIRVEVELSKFYNIELAWLRSRPDRSYLGNYDPEFKMRLLPGRIHENHVPFYKQFAADPRVLLPDSMARLEQLFPDDAERGSMIRRVEKGALFQLKYFKKHYAWIYKGFGIVLQINTPSVAGAVARALAQVIGNLMFPNDDEVRRNALIAIQTHEGEEADRFWLGLAKADQADVRHFALQFALVCGDPQEALELSREWLLLCQLTSSPHDQDLIKSRFNVALPVLHRRQKHHVDPHFTDTTMLEGRFSVERRKFDKSKTSGRFQDQMFWDAHVIVDLRNVGRAVGEKDRSFSKVRRDSNVFGPHRPLTEQAASDWCGTYLQVHTIMQRIETHWVPMFGDAAMAEAPRVRSFLDKNNYTSGDLKLAESWTKKLEEDAVEGAYRRDVSSTELEERGLAVMLTFHLPDDSTEETRFEKSISHRYSKANAADLENELKCHLPMSLLAMKAISSPVDWPPDMQPGSLTMLSLKVLLAVLIPPVVCGQPLSPCFRAGGGILKGNALVALSVFLKNARLLLDYLGSYKDDVFDVGNTEPFSNAFDNRAGSAGAFFIIGPFSTLRQQRLLLPFDGREGFKSIFLSEDESAADRALDV